MDLTSTKPTVTPQAKGRPLVGWAVGLLLAVVIAVPAAWTAFAALVSFTGCFIECSTPEPVDGVLWTSVCLALLAVPVVGGVYAGKGSAD